MPELGDEKAKAIQEVAKTTGKAISAAEKAGGFFSRIFGDGVEAKVGVWSDNAVAKRQINAIDLAVNVQAKLDEVGITEIRALPMKVGFPLIEHASLEEEDDLKEMFANLLLSALNPESESIEKKYVSVLSDMSSKEAILLKFLYEHKFTENGYPGHQKVSFGVKSYRSYRIGDINRYANASEDDVRSLMRMGILKSLRVDMNINFDSSNRSLFGSRTKKPVYGIYTDIEQTAFTEFGIDFASRVIEGGSKGLVQQE